MSNDSSVTVAGYVGAEPRFFAGEGDAPHYVSFRLATTRSYFNRAKNSWVESETTWFTVKAWRNLAKNINESISKGDAVIVHGTLDTQKWTAQDGSNRESLVIDASCVGPNLARGTAKFRPNRVVGSEALSARSFEAASSTKTDSDHLERLAASFVETTDGVYANSEDESLTNGKENESKMALTA